MLFNVRTAMVCVAVFSLLALFSIRTDPDFVPYIGVLGTMGCLTMSLLLMAPYFAFVFDFFTLYQESGADYLYSLLTGYQEPPAGIEVPEGTQYNPYFIAGTAIAMPPPLSDGMIAYAQNQDGNPATDVPETVEQYARDVTAFLAWTAEPHMEHRKRLGFSVMVFLVLFAGLVFYTKQAVWRDTGH
jgi:ubiquinol-cytochrome c reductase cytochrome c1 subunit